MPPKRKRPSKEPLPDLQTATVGEAVSTLVETAVAIPLARHARPIDPTTVTGAPADRLAVYEAAVEAAYTLMETTTAAARARFVIEAGTALRAIRDEGLYRIAYASFEAYVAGRFANVRSRAYQLMEAAPVMGALSKILDTPPVESHTPILGPVLAKDGPDGVRAVVQTVTANGEKVTAASLKRAARQLGYTPAPKGAAPSDDNDDQEQAPPVPDVAGRAGRTAVQRLDAALERAERLDNAVSRSLLRDAEREHAEHAARTIRAFREHVASLGAVLDLRLVEKD